ncbi:hypothetical protein [Bradyrhizobium sp.]|jgi:hypothetical protein|uniref:hypothetical protein n=1 Tax=Bradyrhizobium sp. TaxID=376 RepID=UPI002E03CFD8|nr:hypothetical protein [Bradyrhizobium sp.]
MSLIGLALAGCTTARTPIVAVAVDDVGLTAGVGAQNQGANVTLGYKGAKFAVVPVQTPGGKILSLRDGPDRDNGFSVFAMLGVDAKGGLSPNADIRQVVGVGPAADIWAFGASGVTKDQIKAAKDAQVIR